MTLTPSILVAFLGLGLTALASEPLTFTQVQNGDLGKVSKTPSKPAAEASPVGQKVPTGLPIIIGDETRIEFGNTQYTARVGGGSALSVSPGGRLEFERGSVLLAPKGPKHQLELATQKSQFSVQFTGGLIVETTSNGGGKLICLSDHCTITLNGGRAKTLAPGELLFLIPGKNDFGPLVHINLAMLSATSNLIAGFPVPFERLPELRRAAFSQNSRIRGKSKALVGDATSDTNYQVIFLK